MTDKNKTKELLNAGLKAIPADMVELGLLSIERGTTRFANSIIHQNITAENPYLWTRVILKSKPGMKIGGLSTRNLTTEGITEAMGRAFELAEHSNPDKEFVSLPKKSKAPAKKRKEATIDFVTPEQRASAVKKIVSVCKKHNLTAAGVITSSRYSVGVANNLGVNSYFKGGDSYMTVTAMSDNSSGFALACEKKFSRIDFQELAEIACEKAIISKNPREVKPGAYTVLLEEPAVAELISYLGWVEFGARAFAEKRSIMSKKMGKLITGKNITIIDDCSDPRMIAFPFDFEGVDKKKVVMIDKGIAKGIVTDSFYANKLKMKNTGHAMPQPNAGGPFATAAVMKAGNKTKAEMLKSIDKGILITRFWYTRMVDPDKTIFTGLTRDGTFWVENGKIQYGIKNLRYTINLYETLKQVAMIAKDAILSGEGGQAVVPALLINNFNFSSKTEY
jgi:predicted Zn-dependent protease